MILLMTITYNFQTIDDHSSFNHLSPNLSRICFRKGYISLGISPSSKARFANLAYNCFFIVSILYSLGTSTLSPSDSQPAIIVYLNSFWLIPSTGVPTTGKPPSSSIGKVTTACAISNMQKPLCTWSVSNTDKYYPSQTK